jgi:hypothetical protein
LRLRPLPHPAAPTSLVLFFQDWQTACAHLRDHLLTAPECDAWALVAPGYRALLDPADGDVRWRYAEEALSSQGASAQQLYDLYAEAAAADSRDAADLRWSHTEGRVTVAVGTSGVLLLVDTLLRTAFLPGQGDPEATRQARGAGPGARGLVRERGMRSGRPGAAGHHEPLRERREQERREERWTDEERLYYRVFRPCVQFIKRCHHRHRDMSGRLVRQDYALLKDCLPPRNRLKFADWVALRRQCRGG